MKVTFAGNELTLLGTQIQVGEPLPTALLMTNDLQAKDICDFSGNKLISVVPSLDTEVCDLQTRKFNEQASANATVITVSNDLPFAQARWCGASGLDNVLTLSDYKDHNFGMAFGTLIEELKIQTRAVFVVDSTNTVTYVEYLAEITNEPNYEAALAALNKLS